ncbi:Crp/Fnr family transcriptional regulator [Nocardia sp. NPDC051570]|uniref:Crp/Fnr family transcriptional regulator n=1 Tax=Nocardia sp. NPDC051570 TaxID=3364324 RepID=UPI00379E3F84
MPVDDDGHDIPCERNIFGYKPSSQQIRANSFTAHTRNSPHLKSVGGHALTDRLVCREVTTAKHGGSRGGTTLHFDTLPRFDSMKLLEAGVRQRWPIGAILLHEGDMSDHVLVIESGRVKVSSAAPSGKQVVLGIRGPGELLGELSSIDAGARSATITAISPVISTTVQGSAFRALLISDGALTFELLRTVVTRLREADVQRLDYGAYTVTERLARLLLEYARRYGRPEADRVVIALPLTQTELANAANASREAVAKAFKHLREIGAIRTARRRVELLRPDLLAEVAEGLPNVYSDADTRDPRR